MSNDPNSIFSSLPPAPNPARPATQQPTKSSLWISLAVLGGALAVGFVLAMVSMMSSGRPTAKSGKEGAMPPAELPVLPDDKDTVTTPSGLKYVDLKVGEGKTAAPGNNVAVHYVGTLTNGMKFDSSRDRGEPFTFTLGVGEVIKGWDEGVAGMKEGGKRKLVIPSELGYGAQGSPPKIPPNATLVFEVELMKVR